MGTYTNIYFENENFSINTKNLYPHNIFDYFAKNQEIYYSQQKDYDGDDVFLVFNEPEFDGYKHYQKIDDCAYNFFYNKTNNALRFCVFSDFYYSLYSADRSKNFDETYHKLSEEIDNIHYQYKGLSLVNCCHYTNMIAFVMDGITYRIWILSDKVQDIIIIDNQGNCTRSYDFTLLDLFIGDELLQIYEKIKEMSKIDFFKYVFARKNSKLLKKIIEAYDNYIEPNLTTLNEFLLSYDKFERIELNK